MRILKITVYAGLMFSLATANAGCASSKPARPASTSHTGSSIKYAQGVKRLGYAIQMGAFSELGNAERFTNRLQNKGIDAFYFRKDSGIYAVRFGDFPSRQSARQSADQLVAERVIDSYYIASPDELAYADIRKPASPALKPYPPPEQDLETSPSKPAKQPAPRADDQDLGYIAARTAERFVGIPYQWGGNTVVDGMDCSGFTKAVYNLCGVNIPRTSREQFQAGNQVIKSDLKDGDLVFFGDSAASVNHVGIYVGNGRFVHAPRRGEEIRTAGLDESYFVRRFVGARRYIQ
jgi:cell wall-associated NlpC family hydrolase